MKTLTYRRANRLALLHDEILAAMPELRTAMRVEGRGDQIAITVPDETDEGAISAIVAAHDPTRETPNEALRRRIVELAQSAEGVLLTDLTAGQRNALIAVLLWRAGAIGSDLRVRPLREWVG